MLLQLDGPTEPTDTVERYQHRRINNNATATFPPRPAELAGRKEDITSTVSSVANRSVSANPRPVPTPLMAHGNSTGRPLVLVSAPTTTPGRTSQTEPPARKVDILIYPTVSPETIVVPILSCIIGFPIFALLVICCLRRRAKIARERDRRRNFDLQANTITLVRFNSHHLNNQRSILLQGGDRYPSLDLDTVYEEKSDTHCSSQLDSPAAHMLLTDDSPPDTDNEHC